LVLVLVLDVLSFRAGEAANLAGTIFCHFYRGQT